MSTLVDVETGEVVNITQAEAEKLTAEIKAWAGTLCVKVKEAFDRKAHRAMGYSTWAEYMQAEFDISRSRSYQLVAHAGVVEQLAVTAGIDVSTIVDTPEGQTRDIDLEAVAGEVANRVADLPAEATEEDRAALVTETVERHYKSSKQSPQETPAPPADDAGSEGEVSSPSDPAHPSDPEFEPVDPDLAEAVEEAAKRHLATVTPLVPAETAETAEQREARELEEARVSSNEAFGKHLVGLSSLIFTGGAGLTAGWRAEESLDAQLWPESFTAAAIREVANNLLQLADYWEPVHG